jgi:hypothetical protein
VSRFDSVSSSNEWGTRLFALSFSLLPLFLSSSHPHFDPLRLSPPPPPPFFPGPTSLSHRKEVLL